MDPLRYTDTASIRESVYGIEGACVPLFCINKLPLRRIVSESLFMGRVCAWTHSDAKTRLESGSLFMRLREFVYGRNSMNKLPLFSMNKLCQTIGVGWPVWSVWSGSPAGGGLVGEQGLDRPDGSDRPDLVWIDGASPDTTPSAGRSGRSGLRRRGGTPTGHSRVGKSGRSGLVGRPKGGMNALLSEIQYVLRKWSV